MRIVCTVTNDLSHDQRMDRICTTLAGAGHQVTLIGRLLPDSPTLPDRPYATRRIPCKYHKGKRFYLEFNYRLWRELSQWDFDVLCAVDLDTLVAGYALSGGGRQLVFDAHEWYSETPEVVHRPIVRWVWQNVGRQLAPKAALRYTVGKTIAEQLTIDYSAHFEVVRNLPFTKDYKKEKAEGVILYQGMLNPGRGLELLLAALLQLPGCQLWIVGDGPQRSDLEATARRLGIEDRVRFTGFVPPARLPEFTTRAWLGVNLLEASSPSYYYSLANKALDYIQAGLPSIQMDYPEYRHINDAYECFELIDAYSVESLTTAVLHLYHDKGAYDRLSANCERAARELCWEREAPKLIELYAQLTPPLGA